METDYTHHLKKSHLKKLGDTKFTYEMRKKLEELLDAKTPIKKIQEYFNLSKSTLSYERMRMGSKDIRYDAEYAHQHAGYMRQYTDCTIRKTYPVNYNHYISKLYRLVNEMNRKNLSDSKQECLYYLKLLGADPVKMKNPLSIEEKRKILELRAHGLSIRKIAAKVKRNKNTVNEIIAKFKEKEQENNIKEFCYDQIKNKWSS